MSNPRPRLFLLCFLAPLLLMLAGVAAFNAAVDPYGQFGPNPRFDAHRGNVYTRVAKGELLARDTWRVAILGHSIAEIGLDPAHPAFRERPAVNGCIMGANLYEVEHTLRLALESPNLEEVLLVTTPDQWGTAHNARYDFAKSRLDPARRPAEHRLECLLGLAASEAAFRDFERYLKGKSTIFHPDGFRTIVYADVVAQGSRHAFWFRANQRLRDPVGANGIPDPTRVEMFRRMVRQCRERDVKLVVAFPPPHALSLETTFLMQQEGAFADVRRTALRVLSEEAPSGAWELWDFAGYHAPAMEEIPPPGQKEPLMQGFWESDHIRKELGDLMFDRIYLGRGELGVRLTPENIEEHLASIRRGHEAYQATHPHEVEWLKSVQREIDAGR